MKAVTKLIKQSREDFIGRANDSMLSGQQAITWNDNYEDPIQCWLSFLIEVNNKHSLSCSMKKFRAY